MKAENKEKMYYLKYSLFHPFDAFYEIRFRNKGNVVAALILLALHGIARCLEYQYTGFVMNLNQISMMNSMRIFCTTVVAFLLFAVSNWSVTTLFNGKGDLKNIIIVLGYSSIPLLITVILKTFLSNFIIYEETIILTMFMGIGVVWFLFMSIAGLCVIHEYPLGKNILSILLTFVAALILVFLVILIGTLVEQMVFFFVSIIEEFVRRM